MSVQAQTGVNICVAMKVEDSTVCVWTVTYWKLMEDPVLVSKNEMMMKN